MHIWGRVGPRVGSGRVRLFVDNRGSGRVNVSPGRVQEKWPVDNSALPQTHKFKYEIMGIWIKTLPSSLVNVQQPHTFIYVTFPLYQLIPPKIKLSTNSKCMQRLITSYLVDKCMQWLLTSYLVLTNACNGYWFYILLTNVCNGC